MGITLQDMQEANKAAGQFWLSPDTMRVWRSRVHESTFTTVGRRTYFVISDRGVYGTDRVYRVRVFDALTGRIDIASNYPYRSRSGALGDLKRTVDAVRSGANPSTTN